MILHHVVEGARRRCPGRRHCSSARGGDGDRWFTPAFRASGGADAAHAYLLARDVRGWACGWQAIAAIDTLPLLPTLTMPTLCIAGELDKSSPPATVRVIADAIPGAQFKVIAGAPHMLFIEQPQAVAEMISTFLDTLR